MQLRGRAGEIRKASAWSPPEAVFCELDPTPDWSDLFCVLLPSRLSGVPLHWMVLAEIYFIAAHNSVCPLCWPFHLLFLVWFNRSRVGQYTCSIHSSIRPNSLESTSDSQSNLEALFQKLSFLLGGTFHFMDTFTELRIIQWSGMIYMLQRECNWQGIAAMGCDTSHWVRWLQKGLDHGGEIYCLLSWLCRMSMFQRWHTALPCGIITIASVLESWLDWAIFLQ